MGCFIYPGLCCITHIIIYIYMGYYCHYQKCYWDYQSIWNYLVILSSISPHLLSFPSLRSATLPLYIQKQNLNCSSNGKTHSYEGSDGHGVNWFFVSMTIGFIVGFWIVIAPLLICRSWRYAYFHFLDHVWFKLQSFRSGSITV